jgi:hypothetical protein
LATMFFTKQRFDKERGHAQIGSMTGNTKPRTEPMPAPGGGRVPRPVLARKPANPRSLEEIIADAKKRYAKALAYLAAK